MNVDLARRIGVAIVLIAAFFIAEAADAADTFTKIRDSGQITFGYRECAVPLVVSSRAAASNPPAVAG